MKKEAFASAKVVMFSCVAGELVHGLTHGAVTGDMSTIAVLFGAAASMICAVKSYRIAFGPKEPSQKQKLTNSQRNLPSPK
jgi:hypothetical protein